MWFPRLFTLAGRLERLGEVGLLGGHLGHVMLRQRLVWGCSSQVLCSHLRGGDWLADIEVTAGEEETVEARHCEWAGRAYSSGCHALASGHVASSKPYSPAGRPLPVFQKAWLSLASLVWLSCWWAGLGGWSRCT